MMYSSRHMPACRALPRIAPESGLRSAATALNSLRGIGRRRFLARTASAALATAASPLIVFAQGRVGTGSPHAPAAEASLGGTLARYASGLRFGRLPEARRRSARGS